MTRNKFGAVRTTVDGITFASKAEARRYQELRILERGQFIRDLQVQPKFPLVIGGLKVATYIGDFAYWQLKNARGGEQHVVEDVKGMKTPVYRLKKKLVAALYGIEIHEVTR